MRPFVRDHSLRPWLDAYKRRAWGTPAILDAGSGGRNLGLPWAAVTSVDVAHKPNIDRVADLHALPAEWTDKFDLVICTAVLQYCERPEVALRELARVLKPGGTLYLDVPWQQPYNRDTPDLWRFSEEGVRALLRRTGFTNLTISPSIRPGSAWYDLTVRIAGSLTPSRTLNFALRHIVGLIASPARYLRTAEPAATAGAFVATAIRA